MSDLDDTLRGILLGAAIDRNEPWSLALGWINGLVMPDEYGWMARELTAPELLAEVDDDLDALRALLPPDDEGLDGMRLIAGETPQSVDVVIVLFAYGVTSTEPRIRLSTAPGDTALAVSMTWDGTVWRVIDVDPDFDLFAWSRDAETYIKRGYGPREEQ
jgi:hypothetical protein